MENQHFRHQPPFTLRLPFRLAPGKALPDTRGIKEWNGLRIEIEKLEAFSGALLVHGFQDSSSAQDFIASLKAALTWAALQEEFSFEASLDLRGVVYADDPEEAARNLRSMGFDVGDHVDGFGDGAAITIYTEGAKLRHPLVGTVAAGVEINIESLLSSLVAGLDPPPPASSGEDEKISTALDLYFSSFFERTLRGKLLTLVTALEALITRPERPPEVVELLRELCAKAADLRKQYAAGTPEAIALDSLRNELHFKSRSSISSEVQNLARRAAAFLGQDSHAAAADARAVYSTRSHLTHEGSVEKEELRGALAKALNLVRSIMIAVMREPSLIHGLTGQT